MKLGNVSTVEAWKAGTTPPPGTYTARIDDASEGKSRNDHPQFTIEWTVVGGPYDGASIRQWLVVPKTGPGNEIGLKKLVALIDAVGIDRNVDDFEVTPGMLVGKHAVIVCVGEPGRDDPTKTFTSVVGVKEAGDIPQPAAAANGSNGSGEPPLPF